MAAPAGAAVEAIVVAARVRPNSQLADATGVDAGTKGAIRVDRHMATNLPDVYAARDCVETWHRMLDSPTYLPLGTTGLRELEAHQAGFEAITAHTESWDHKASYPGAHQLSLRVIGDRQTGQLLGAQILGPPWQAEVAKRIDVYAPALSAGMTVDGINDLDLSYTLPFRSRGDAVQLAAQAWTSTVAGGQP